jgi:hypothetical protein
MYTFIFHCFYILSLFIFFVNNFSDNFKKIAHNPQSPNLPYTPLTCNKTAALYTPMTELTCKNLRVIAKIDCLNDRHLLVVGFVNG